MKLDENIYKTTVVFLMLFSVQDMKEGKIEHKKIIRDIKKYLAKKRSKHGRDFVRMVNTASDSLITITKKMVIGENKSTLLHISPGKLISIFKDKEPELYKLWGIDDNVFNKYFDLHKDDNLSLPTIMYYNRICETYLELVEQD